MVIFELKKGSYQPSVTSNNLNIQRLFCDRIEVYAETIDATKIAITSGIIRIALRSFLEAIRLQTFSKYGLQQIQGEVSNRKTRVYGFHLSRYGLFKSCSLEIYFRRERTF